MGAFVRSDALRRLEQTRFDVVVIGGGVTGAGCALDAASRGLTTALIERDDFASGTSSRSSKMVHGGLRYLQQGDVPLVYEALAERQRLLRNAPHLVKIVPFVLPVLTGGGGAVPRGLAPALDLAMWIYDLTGGVRIGRLHDRLDDTTTLAHIPTLHVDRLRTSFLYYDAQVDDARLTLAVIRTACVGFDAVCANRVAATSFTKDESRRINGVEVEVSDARGESTGSFTIATKSVVNATGVWADDVDQLAEPTHHRALRPAKGVHITVPRHRVRNDVAAIFQARSDHRWVFIIPWGDHCFIGTTDTDYHGPLDDPRCTRDDVAYLLRSVNVEAGTDLTGADITGSWAGLRPLVAEHSGANHRSADLSRRHSVTVTADGVTTVTGGKLTTYRAMAQDTIDTVLREYSDIGDGRRRRSKARTRNLPLLGADRYGDLIASDIDPGLLERHGSESRTILSMIDTNPSLATPVVPGLPYLNAELLYSARYEMALTLDDLLSRRTRARILDRDATMAAAPAAAAVVASELGWSDDDIAEQVATFRELAGRDFSGTGFSGTNFSEQSRVTSS